MLVSLNVPILYTWIPPSKPKVKRQTKSNSWPWPMPMDWLRSLSILNSRGLKSSMWQVSCMGWLTHCYLPGTFTLISHGVSRAKTWCRSRAAFSCLASVVWSLRLHSLKVWTSFDALCTLTGRMPSKLGACELEKSALYLHMQSM